MNKNRNSYIEIGAVKVRRTMCLTESWKQSYEPRCSFIFLTWSPIAAEPGAGLSLEVGLVMGQSSHRGQNLVETLASWSGSRKTEVPATKLSQDEEFGSTGYRDQGMN